MRGPAFLLVMALLGAGAALPAAASDEPEATATSDHFSITWVTDPESPHAPDLTDADGDSVPDAVERLLEAFELARELEIDQLGYPEPPVEGHYEIYVARISGGGYVQPAPGGEGPSRASYVVAPPQLADSGTTDLRMRTWAAHEYFHAIQQGLDAEEDGWIREATATWVETLVPGAEGNAGLNLLPTFVSQPRLGLKAVNGRREYGAFVFIRFLTERFGDGSAADPGLVRELWQEMASPEGMEGAGDRSSLEAIEVVLERRGVTPGEAWGEYLLWAWRPEHFEHGDAYREVLGLVGWPAPSRATAVRGDSCLLPLGELPRWAADHVLLRPARRGPKVATAVLSIQGPPDSGAFVLIRTRRGDPEERLLSFDEDGSTSVTLPFGRRQVRAVIVGAGHAGERPGRLAYSLRVNGVDRVETTGPLAQDGVTFPNTASLFGTVRCGGRPVEGVEVVVTETEVVSGKFRTWTAETQEDGGWRQAVDPDANATYTAAVAEPLAKPGSASHAISVRVSPVVRIDDPVVVQGEPVVVAGAVHPPHPDATVVVEFRRPDRVWREGPTTTTDGDGAFAADLVLPATGFWEVRVRVTETGDEDHEPGLSLGKHLVRVQGA